MKYTTQAIIDGERYVLASDVGERTAFPSNPIRSMSYEIASGIVRGFKAADSPVGRNIVHIDDAEFIEAMADFGRELGEHPLRAFVFEPFARKAGYESYAAAIWDGYEINQARADFRPRPSA